MFRRGGYRRNFGQRLGFYSAESRERLRGKHPTWIHAVSVGEIVIALKLADELRALRPDLKCVLTTTTTTGHALAEKTAPEWMRVLYAPLDFWPVMRRAFRVIAPQRIVLIEAEVWPNLVAEAKKRAIPVMLANARLSPRSERRFRRFRFFVTPTFRQLDLVCVPATEDAEQWKNLGVKPPQIHAVGNIKYDASNRRHSSGDVQRLIKTAIETTRSILFGGSTHRGEEKILIDVFCALQSEFPNLFLVLAPRHVERASEIEADLRGRNLRVDPAQRRGQKHGAVRLFTHRYHGRTAGLVRDRDDCFHRKKSDRARRPKPRGSDQCAETGNIRSAYGEFCESGEGTHRGRRRSVRPKFAEINRGIAAFVARRDRARAARYQRASRHSAASGSGGTYRRID